MMFENLFFNFFYYTFNFTKLIISMYKQILQIKVTLKKKFNKI